MHFDEPWPIHLPAVEIVERVHDHQHLLLWQARGHSQLTLDGEHTALDSGHAVWIPANVRHDITVHANSVLLPMFFPVHENATTLQGVVVIAVDRDLRTLMLACVQAQNSIIQPNADIARQILTVLERTPVGRTVLPMPTSEVPLRVARSLHFNPGDGRTIADLAAAAHASARTVERGFIAETGMTFRQWRKENRMTAAAALFRSVTGVEAVARRVGYTDTSAFRRAFKAHFGLAPSDYARRYRADS